MLHSAVCARFNNAWQSAACCGRAGRAAQDFAQATVHSRHIHNDYVHTIRALLQLYKTSQAICRWFVSTVQTFRKYLLVTPSRRGRLLLLGVMPAAAIV